MAKVNFPFEFDAKDIDDSPTGITYIRKVISGEGSKMLGVDGKVSFTVINWKETGRKSKVFRNLDAAQGIRST